MRRFAFYPVIAAATRRAYSTPIREVGVPLYLPAPEYGQLPAGDYVEFDAEDLRVDASGTTIGDDEDEDDDFY